jgi:predicted nuclease of predicted toxin-antitoxin system
VRILADTNIVAQAVRALRDGGHDVVYAAERALDPDDEALLAEAVEDSRVFVTKDHDIGALVYRDLRAHCGVLLVDDLGFPAAESALILGALCSHPELLAAGAFLRAGAEGVRERQG